MRSGCLALAGALMVAMGGGCQQNDEPPPQFARGMMVDGRPVVPLSVPSRANDRDILGAAAAEDEVDKPSSGGNARAEVGEVVVDDSSARAVAASYVALLNAGQYRRVTDLVVDADRDLVQTLMDGLAMAVDARRGFLDAVGEAFPDEQFELPQLGNPMLATGIRYELRDVEPTGEDAAEAQIGFVGGGDAFDQLELGRLDGAWRINFPDQMNAALVKAMYTSMEELAGRLRQIEQQVAQGDIASAQVLRRVFRSTMEELQATGGAMPADDGDAAEPVFDEPEFEDDPFGGEDDPFGGDGDSAGSGDDPFGGSADNRSNSSGANDQPRRRPQRERSDELDGTYTGPGMLRAR